MSSTEKIIIGEAKDKIDETKFFLKNTFDMLLSNKEDLK